MSTQYLQWAALSVVAFARPYSRRNPPSPFFTSAPVVLASPDDDVATAEGAFASQGAKSEWEQLES